MYTEAMGSYKSCKINTLQFIVHLHYNNLAWPAWGHAGSNTGQTLRCFQDDILIHSNEYF